MCDLHVKISFPKKYALPVMHFLNKNIFYFRLVYFVILPFFMNEFLHNLNFFDKNVLKEAIKNSLNLIIIVAKKKVNKIIKS